MIEIVGLRLQIGEASILDGIDLRVAAGESAGLIGPNGSGKTSLLRCLLGLAPFTGRAAIGGHDVAAEPVAARRLLAWLPQRPAFGEVTATEALGFVARLRGIPRERINAMLDRVGLLAHATARTRSFSGGMLQRLALAQVLLIDAPVLLLDEPTANLDREAQEVFDQVVAAMRRSGRTLLLASHRGEEIRRLTDRAIELDRGRIRSRDGCESPAGGLAPVVSIGSARGAR